MSEIHPLPLTRSEEAGNKPVRLVRAAVRIALITRHPDGDRCLFVRHHIKGLELPGGAIEAGEMPLQAALRELAEEAGIQLPADHLLKLAAFIPVVDHRGGNWLDVFYVTVVTPEQLTVQQEAEFPICWLTAEEIQSKVDPQLGSYQAALLALDGISYQ